MKSIIKIALGIVLAVFILVFFLDDDDYGEYQTARVSHRNRHSHTEGYVSRYSDRYEDAKYGHRHRHRYDDDDDEYDYDDDEYDYDSDYDDDDEYDYDSDYDDDDDDDNYSYDYDNDYDNDDSYYQNNCRNNHRQQYSNDKEDYYSNEGNSGRNNYASASSSNNNDDNYVSDNIAPGENPSSNQTSNTASSNNSSSSTSTSGSVMALSSAKFNKLIANTENDVGTYIGDSPCVVVFWADWCSASVNDILPIMEKLSSTYNGKVEFYKVNADKCPDIYEAYELSALPALLFCHGEDMELSTGAPKEAGIKKQIDSML